MGKKKIESFMYMLLKEARKNSLVELCKEYDITEDEIDEIIRYVSDKLEIEIY